VKLPKSPSRQTIAFGFSIVDRCLRESLGRRQFGIGEQRRVIEFFDGVLACVYCGSSEVTRWDHLTPIRAGGETVLGNMVPACSSCDDSKAQGVFETWMLGSAPRSPASLGVTDIEQRISKLLAYRTAFGYTVTPEEHRLTAEELRDLAALRAGLQKLREDADDLARRFARRTS